MKMKQEILDKINNIIDYQESKRVKLSVFVNEVDKDCEEYLLFDNDLLIKTDKDEVRIGFDDIKEINLSLTCRLYNPGVVESNMGKWVVKRWQRGAPLTVGQHVNYYLDIDIVLENKVLEFENNNLYISLEFIEYLENQGIKINDPLEIKSILAKYSDPVDLVRYLNNQYPKLAKLHNLDNPRGVEFIK